MTSRLIALSDRKLSAALKACGLTAPLIRLVMQQRPFADDAALGAALDDIVMGLDEVALARALAAVPEPALEQGEPAAREAAFLALRLYRDRFGYPFVSAIAAPSADELLMRVRIRLGNDPEPEGRAAREHLRRLVRGRLQTLMEQEP